MKQLTGLDATFLYLETPEMPMHIGALYLLELPAGYKGRYVRDLRKHLASRLTLAPALQRRLWMMPLNLANPAWVDCTVDLDNHVSEIKLPKGSDLAALEAEVSRLHPKLLDRTLPLWRFYVFEGLKPAADGSKRVGVYSQLHHAAADGQGAVAIANAILDLQATPRVIDAKPSSRPKTFKLSMAEMLRGALASEVEQIRNIVNALPATVDAVKTVASQSLAGSRLLGGRSAGVSNVTVAPRTTVNTSIGTGRAFAAVSLSLPEVKALGRAHEATINDMVLMVCSTALRRYFSKRRTLPKKSMIAAVPVSLREKGDTRSDNQASMSLMSLGTHIADPAKRLAHIKSATQSMKSTMGGLKGILPTDFPSIGVPWLMEAATALYGKTKLADRIPQLANLVISNVPGPPVPLYLAGARLLNLFPTSIIVHGMGLNITVQSYDQTLGFGLMADAEAMPDVRELADAIAIAFDDIRALPLPGEAETEPRSAGEWSAAMAKTMSNSVGRTVSKAARSLVAGAVKGTVDGVVKGASRVAGAARKSDTTAPPAARGRKAAKS